ncbi:MAG TPA: phosphotransferase, partial [Actinoplanes sp.]|nr:phosphotransferase [Actinoplanes sp.]
MGEDLLVVFDGVAQRFGLGRLVADAVRIPGGLSNELWRLVTRDGVFAVKRMIVNADRPDFVDNVETAFAVERRAWVAGVAMPQPVAVLDTGRALAQVEGSLFRVHRWVDGQPGAGAAEQAAGLLANIHAAVGGRRWEAAPEAGWTADRWGADLVELARR